VTAAMIEVMQQELMRVCLLGAAASLAVLAMRTEFVRGAFARLTLLWRSMTALGRVAVCFFLIIGFIIADKTNRVEQIENGELRMENGGALIGDSAILHSQFSTLNSSNALAFTVFSISPSNESVAAEWTPDVLPYGSRIELHVKEHSITNAWSPSRQYVEMSRRSFGRYAGHPYFSWRPMHSQYMWWNWTE